MTLADFAHSWAESGHLAGIVICADLVPLSVGGEHPFDIELGNGVQAVGENVPGVPRLFWSYVKFLAPMVPEQGIAGEQPTVVYMVGNVPLGMAGNRDRDNARLNDFLRCRDIAGKGSGIGIVSMDPRSGVIPASPFPCISDFVAVGEQDMPDSTEAIYCLRETAAVARRVNQEISRWPDNKVGVSAKRTGSVVTQSMHPAREFIGKNAGWWSNNLAITNRLRRTRHRRPPQSSRLYLGLRLAGHKRPPPVVHVDEPRSPMSRYVAPNATGIHKPRAIHIVGVNLISSGHQRLD